MNHDYEPFPLRPEDPARPDLSEPVVVLSDLHLNWNDGWEGRLRAIRPLWQGARSVVFNGDTLAWYTAAKAACTHKVLATIHHLCWQDRVRPVFLGGNSDHDIPGARHLTLAGGRVLVMHGDAAFPSISPWRSCAKAMRHARRAALETMPAERAESLPGQLEASRQAMAHIRRTYGPRAEQGDSGHGPEDGEGNGHGRGLPRERPWWRDNPAGLLAILRAWWVTPRMVARFAAEYAPAAEYVIIGHTHRPGIWRRDGRTIVNTGSFTRRARAYRVRLARGVLSVCDTQMAHGVCALGRELGRFEIAATPATSGPGESMSAAGAAPEG